MREAGTLLVEQRPDGLGVEQPGQVKAGDEHRCHAGILTYPTESYQAGFDGPVPQRCATRPVLRYPVAIARPPGAAVRLFQAERLSQAVRAAYPDAAHRLADQV